MARCTVEELREEIETSLVSGILNDHEVAQQVQDGGDPEDVLYCVKWQRYSHHKNWWRTSTLLVLLQEPELVRLAV